MITWNWLMRTPSSRRVGGGDCSGVGAFAFPFAFLAGFGETRPPVEVVRLLVVLTGGEFLTEAALGARLALTEEAGAGFFSAAFSFLEGAGLLA